MKPVTDFKLGLFALAAIASFLVAVLALGMHGRRRPAREYHALFDESVQGLDVGAPVKFRGVEIGHVATIDVAADARRVDVTLAIDASAAARLDLAASRAQLESQGLTGVKLVQLEPAATAAGEPGTIATVPSLGQQLEDAGTQVAHELPALVADARATLHHLDDLAADARETLHSGAGLVPKASVALAQFGALAQRADGALDAIRRLVAHADATVVPGAARATDAIAELGHRALGPADTLDAALRDVRDAARSIRGFVDELEREPDMLVKGHTR